MKGYLFNYELNEKRRAGTIIVQAEDEKKAHELAKTEIEDKHKGHPYTIYERSGNEEGFEIKPGVMHHEWSWF